jgi:hypothetical protein
MPSNAPTDELDALKFSPLSGAVRMFFECPAGDEIALPVVDRLTAKAATITIRGILVKRGCDAIRAALLQLEREGVNRIRLRIESAGGFVAGSSRVLGCLKALRKRKVHTFAEVHFAAGPALLIAAACDYSIARPLAVIGPLACVWSPGQPENFPSADQYTAVLSDELRELRPAAVVPWHENWTFHGEAAEARGIVDACQRNNTPQWEFFERHYKP